MPKTRSTTIVYKPKGAKGKTIKGSCKPVDKQTFEDQILLYFMGRTSITRAAKIVGLSVPVMMKRMRQYLSPMVYGELPDMFFGRRGNIHEKTYTLTQLMQIRVDNWDKLGSQSGLKSIIKEMNFIHGYGMENLDEPRTRRIRPVAYFGYVPERIVDIAVRKDYGKYLSFPKTVLETRYYADVGLFADIARLNMVSRQKNPRDLFLVDGERVDRVLELFNAMNLSNVQNPDDFRNFMLEFKENYTDNIVREMDGERMNLVVVLP